MLIRCAVLWCCAASSGCFSFAYPSTQQQMLVWKSRPKWCASPSLIYNLAIFPPCHDAASVQRLQRLCGACLPGSCSPERLCGSVMVLKKLGAELMDEFLATVQFLGAEEGMQVCAQAPTARRT